MAVFLLFFREAFESAMICSILATYLTLIGHRNRLRDIWTGIVAAIFASLIAGITIYSTVKIYEGTSLEYQIEGVSYLLAWVMLTYVARWVSKNENLQGELQSKVDSALSVGSRFAIAGFVFLAVLREGLEMVVFMIPLASITNPVFNIIQGSFGILSGAFLGYLIYAVGKNINLTYFFKISTILLVIFAGGFLVSGIGEFHILGLTFGQTVVWDTSSFLSSDSVTGHLLHSLIGYTDKPTILQLSSYLLYLTAIGIYRTKQKKAV